MNFKYSIQVSIIFIFIVQFSILCAQKTETLKIKNPPVTVENTELLTIVSKQVPNQVFQIKIDLPGSYHESDTMMYSVLYLTDADYLFGTATDMVEYLRWGGFMPEIIIVGIAYGTKGKGNMRSRDFRPYPDENGIIGASRFIKFITEELFPLIDKNYRVNTDDKTLAGFSAGGRFGTYVLFTQPDLFQKYIINSPVVGNNNRWGFRLEEEYFEERKDLPAKVYMAMGEIESYSPPFPEFVNKIKSRSYKGLVFKEEFLTNGRHMSVPAEALSRGMKYVFSQNSTYELMITLINENDIEYAIAQYQQIKHEKADQFNFHEDELNNLGYLLLEMEKYNDAIKIFKLNIENYPNSANLYDSLADAYMTTGDNELAIKYAKKTLSVLSRYPQPNGEQIKSWALEKLKKLNADDKQKLR